MAAQWRKRAGRVLFPEVLPVCNGRRQACERPPDGLRFTIKGAHTCELPFLLSRLSYMRDLPTERADGLEGRIDGVDGGDG